MTIENAIKLLQDMADEFPGAELFMETAPMGPNDTSEGIKRKTISIVAFSGLEGRDPDGTPAIAVVAVSFKTLAALIPAGTKAGKLVKVPVPGAA